MEFGEHDKIQAFSVRWSDVEHYKNESLASLDEMTRCIREHKAIVLPNFKEDDFARLRKLATATKLTVTEIMPFYGEGMFGSAPANDVPPEFVTPFAELEAMAELNNTNISIRLLCPILADEAKRLLETKNRCTFFRAVARFSPKAPAPTPGERRPDHFSSKAPCH
jgi:hypothetical protein